jgi:hypothetical protein
VTGRLARLVRGAAALAVAAVVCAPAASAADTTATTAASPFGESFTQVTLTGGDIGAQPVSMATHDGNILVGQFLGAVLLGNPRAVAAPPALLQGQPIQVEAQPKGGTTPIKLLWVPRADDTGGWWHVQPPQKLDLPSGAWDFPSEVWVPFTPQAFTIVDKLLHPAKYAVAPAPPPAPKPAGTGSSSLRVVLIGVLAALAAGVGVTVATRRGPRHRLAG